MAEKNRLRGERIMRRVGARFNNKEIAANWTEWHRNYKDGILEMWSNRANRLQYEIDSLQMKFNLTTQSGGEAIMRNVAKRLLMGEVSLGIIAWIANVRAYKNQLKAELIFKR